MDTETLSRHEPEKLADGTKVYRVPGPKKRGQQLRAMREQAKATLRELEELCKIDHSLISRYESGERPVSVDTYMQLLHGIEKIKQEKERRAHVQAIADELLAGSSLYAALTGPPPTEQEMEVFRAERRVYRPDNSRNYLVEFFVNGRAYKESANTESHTEALDFLRKRIEEELREAREQRKRQVAELESLNIDAPIISELIESFRREIAEKDARLQEMSRALEKSAGD